MNDSEKFDWKHVAQNLRVAKLVNTDYDTFWYSKKDFSKGFNQDKAKVGDKFWDGNNGDKHVVLAVGYSDRWDNEKQETVKVVSRVVVKNVGQDLPPMLVYWDEPFEVEGWTPEERYLRTKLSQQEFRKVEYLRTGEWK